MKLTSLALLSVGYALAGPSSILRIKGAAGTEATLSGENGMLTITAPRCIDRSNWCAPWKDLDCVMDPAAPVGKAVVMAGGHSIKLHSDGLLAFDSPTCIGVEQSAAPAGPKEVGSGAQLKFGTSGARVHVDANNKLWIQTPNVQDGNGVAMFPPTMYPTAYPTASPTTSPISSPAIRGIHIPV